VYLVRRKWNARQVKEKDMGKAALFSFSDTSRRGQVSG